jgi:hypothetical protein
MASLWTPELKAKVARLWDKHSDSVIARILWEEDRVSFSRNAIIGARHRMNAVGVAPEIKKTVTARMRGAAGPAVQKINRKRQGDHHAVTKISAGGNGGIRVTQSNKADSLPNLRCVEIAPLNLTLAELDQATQCHYIPGDDMLYCGHPVMAGSPYCVPHKHLCAGYSAVSVRSTYREVAA